MSAKAGSGFVILSVEEYEEIRETLRRAAQVLEEARRALNAQSKKGRRRRSR